MLFCTKLNQYSEFQIICDLLNRDAPQTVRVDHGRTFEDFLFIFTFLHPKKLKNAKCQIGYLKFFSKTLALCSSDGNFLSTKFCISFKTKNIQLG